jgi:hypothetical protein
LHKLTPDELRPDREGRVQEKPHFWELNHWLDGCGAVSMNHRQLDPSRTTEWGEWSLGRSTWLSYVKEQKKQKNSGQQRRHREKGCDRD